MRNKYQIKWFFRLIRKQSTDCTLLTNMHLERLKKTHSVHLPQAAGY